MDKEKPTYEELEARLAEAEAIIEALQSHQVDAIVGEKQVALVRLREMREALRETEERCRALIKCAEDHIFVLDQDFRYVTANPSALKAGGFTLEDIVGKGPRELFPEDAEFYLSQYRRAFETGEPVRFERELRLPHGVHWFSVALSPIRDARGRVTGLMGISRDITERKRAEEALRYQATLLESVSDAVITTGLDFTIQSWNSVAEALYGWRAEEVIGKPMGQVVPTEYPDDRREAVLAQFQAEDVWQGEVIQRHKDGSDLSVLASVSLVRDDAGHPVSVLAINRDITERKRVEEEASYERDLLQTLLDNIPDYVYFKDRDRRFVRASNSFRDLFKRDLVDIIGKVDEELFPPEIAEETANDDRHVIQTGTPLINKEEGGESIGGEEHWVLTTKLPWYDEDGNIIGLFGLSREITERKRAEEALRESEEKFRNLAEQSPNMIFINQQGRVVYANEKCEELTGYTREEFYSPDFDFFTLIAPDCLDLVEANFSQHMDGQDIPAYEYALVNKEGKRMEVIITSKLVRYRGESAILGIVTDITERKQAEARLAETNQLLETILQYTHVLVAYLDPLFNFIRVNRAYAEADERDPSFFPGKNHFDLYPNAENEAIFQHVVETGEPHFAFAKPFEYAEHPERGVTHWDWSLVPIKDSSGTVAGLILTLANVTERVQAQEALKRSEERYALAQRAANIGSWDWNIPTGHLYWSDEIEPMFGFRRGEFGATFEAFLQCVHPEDRQLVMDSVNVCVQQGADYAIEHRIVWPDGTTRWVAEIGDVFRDQDGQAIRMIGVVRDITARKHTEEALLRRVGELSTLHSIAHTVATVVDLPQTLGAVAEAMTYLFDARATFITVPDAEYMELQILAGFERTSGAFATMTRAFPLAEMPISRQVLDQGQTVVLPDVQSLSLPASVRPYVRDLDLHALILVPLRARGAIVGMLAMGSDRMGRAFDPAEVALVETIASDVAGAVESTRLAEQARVAAVDAERQRLARELHDSATQSLYSITLFANGWRTMAEQGRLDNVADCFERIGDAGQQALKEMRLLIHQLRPPILEEVGLVGAIQQRLDTVEHRVNIETRLLTQGEVDQLPEAVEEQLFHIAQEALNNALRHAHATTVTVQVCAEDDRFILSVEDDGVGFDPSADTAGMGLVNMRARAAAIGSKVRITSAPQQGTTVEVTLVEPHER